jgi:hypothetical protein
MSPRAIQQRLGIGACVVALFLLFIGIPNWVSSPSNVRNIVLAPTFWPYVLTASTGLAGVGLILAGRSASPVVEVEDGLADDGNAWFRLAALAVIMVLTMFALPRLGMVWTAMIVFFVTALLLRTRHRRTALICAVLIPLGLYMFFAHVAGVAIPQGIFVRLP